MKIEIASEKIYFKIEIEEINDMEIVQKVIQCIEKDIRKKSNKPLDTKLLQEELAIKEINKQMEKAKPKKLTKKQKRSKIREERGPVIDYQDNIAIYKKPYDHLITEKTEPNIKEVSEVIQLYIKEVSDSSIKNYAHHYVKYLKSGRNPYGKTYNEITRHQINQTSKAIKEVKKQHLPLTKENILKECDLTPTTLDLCLKELGKDRVLYIY